jgi:hypothetical protein
MHLENVSFSGICINEENTDDYETVSICFNTALPQGFSVNF